MKLLRPTLLLLPALLLGGCAHMSDVTPAGTDRYSVTYNAGMRFRSWVDIKNEARDRARQFCVEQGKRMVEPEVTSNHSTGITPKAATVTFACEDTPPPTATAP